MTRIALLTALVGSALLSVPVVVALTFAVLAPAVLAPALGGAADEAAPLPAATRRGPGSAERRAVLVWADAHVGQPYRMGAAGPAAWDCSSFTQAAYAQVGVGLPRTAQQQRDWLAAGHGTRIPPGAEEAADLIFWDSYLGPATIGHVVLVDDPTRRRSVEAHNTRTGTGYFTYHPNHHRFEIWRPHLPAHAQKAKRGGRALADQPSSGVW